jgi:hypothetical protein
VFAATLLVAVPSAIADATYSQTITLPIPPASNFMGSSGGDGWAVALSSDRVYNVFHHSSQLEVACHVQIDASACPSYPVVIQDPSSDDFLTSGHPGMYLDQTTGRLYVYATRASDFTAGVVCVDTVTASFCGFTALTGVGEADSSVGIGETSMPMLVGHRWFAFNYVTGTGAGGPTGTGTQNRLLCFDLSTGNGCAGQPYAVDFGPGTFDAYTFPAPATAAIGNDVIVPAAFTNASEELACYDTTTGANCAGAWPVNLGSIPYIGNFGPPIPLLDSTGSVQGLCLPDGTDECFTLTGASTTTPAGLSAVVTGNTPWNGTAVTLGPRIYVPDGNLDAVECFDFSTGVGCPNFPFLPANLSYLYTADVDPQRPTCLWVNADGGTAQIQNFDAYSAGSCGERTIRVLVSQFVAPQQQCMPNTYRSLQLTSPVPGSYTSGTIEFDDGSGNPISGIPTMPLDATGSVDLTGLDLNTASGTPQFLITLTGAASDLGQIQVKLTWSSAYDTTCLGGGQTVQKEDTTVTTSMSAGDNTATTISVPPNTVVTDSATLAGNNAPGATGTVHYTWYSDSNCNTAVSTGAELPITTPGTLPDSAPVALATGTYYPVASYSGDAGNNSSASTCGAEVLTVASAAPTPTTLDVSAASGDYADATAVSAVLTNSNTAAPISGKSVTLQLDHDESCTGTTDGTGTVSCQIAPGEAPGSYKLAGSFAGDGTFAASGGSASLMVTQEETALAYTGDASVVNSTSMALSGTLTTDDPSAGTALPGKVVTFTVGSGGSAQSCSGTTDPTGSASCTIGSASQTAGSVAVTASFAGDSFYQPADASSSATVGTPTADGAFVIGDLSAGAPTTGTNVLFWGAQWSKTNQISAGAAPPSMKGFASSATTLDCGATFATQAGAGSLPPAALPAVIEVIVTSKVTQKGSTISGTIAHIVLVRIQPGYADQPGTPGTGTIVGVVC